MFEKLRKNAELRHAINDMLGPSIGILAWSIVLNLAIIKTGFELFRTICMSLSIYAGSVQLAAVPLMNGHYPILVIVITSIVINSRFIIYSASIAPHFQHLPFFQRCILGYLNGDISFAVFSKKYSPIEPLELRSKIYTYYLGTSITNWLVWQFGLLVAIFFGTQIPDAWNFSYAGTLVLLCLITPSIKNLKDIGIAFICILVAALTINLPYRLGILCTVLTAMLCAYLIEEWQKKHV